MKLPVEVHSKTTVSIDFGYRPRLKHLVWAVAVLVVLVSYGAPGIQNLVMTLVPPALGKVVFGRAGEIERSSVGQMAHQSQHRRRNKNRGSGSGCPIT
jgi:hypothetical protein